MEVIGRFPVADECDQYRISRLAPVWLPALAGQKFHPTIEKLIPELR